MFEELENKVVLVTGAATELANLLLKTLVKLRPRLL